MNIIRIVAGLCLAIIFSGSHALPRVLVVDSYHPGFAWSHDWRQGLAAALDGKVTLDYVDMDSKRLHRDEHEARADAILKAIAAQPPDLVVTGDDAALRYVGTRLAGTRIPVVYLGVNQNPRLYLQEQVSNVTGVLEVQLISRNIVLMQQLLPAMQRALLLFDNDLTSEILRARFFGQQDSIQLGRIRVDLVRAIDYADWQRQVRQAPARYQAIWAGLYQTLRDGHGKVVADTDVIAWTAAHSSVPVFAFWDFAVGPERAIGGLVLSGQEQGRQAAVLVQRILFQRQLPGSLFPQGGDGGTLLFSRSGLARHGLTVPAAWSGQVRLTE